MKKRLRPLSRLERQLEDAPAGCTLDMLAREVAVRLARRHPSLSVLQAGQLLRRTVRYLRTADDTVDQYLQAAEAAPPTRMQVATRNGGLAASEARVETRGRKKNPVLLRKVAEFRKQHPDYRNCTDAHRLLRPGISLAAFRRYWAAAAPHTPMEA